MMAIQNGKLDSNAFVIYASIEKIQSGDDTEDPFDTQDFDNTNDEDSDNTNDEGI
jgi:hypothetical protein